MKNVLGLAVTCTALLFAPTTTWAQATSEAPADVAVAPDSGSDGTVSTAPGAPASQVQVVEAGAPPSQVQVVEAGAVGTASTPPVENDFAPASDGVRFRGAIAVSGGGEFASGFSVGMGGIEGRIGVQINNLIGLYVQPSLAFGAGSVNGSSATVVTGTAGISALIDFTIADHFFFGVGGGYGILNNPTGPELHLRVGGYPVMAVGQDGYSRQGLMLGVDARVFFLSDFSGLVPITQILASIGYEVF